MADVVIPDRMHAVVGYRAFKIVEDDRGNAMIAPLFPHFGRDEDHKLWNQEDFTAVARCAKRRGATNGHPRPSPASNCACGIYAYAEIKPAVSEVTTASAAYGHVVGIIAAEGKILRATRGFRAEKATVLAFFNPLEQMVIKYGKNLEAMRREYDLDVNEKQLIRKALWTGVERFIDTALLKGIPVLPWADRFLFHGTTYQREWAAERNCVMYFDTIVGEPTRMPIPSWHKGQDHTKQIMPPPTEDS